MLEVIMGLLAAFDLSTFGDLLEAMPRRFAHSPIEAMPRTYGHSLIEAGHSLIEAGLKLSNIADAGLKLSH